MNLYTDYAQQFSDKRWGPWEGWKKLVPILSEKQNFSVLDVGCGNGRLLQLLVNYHLDFDTYTGIDYSKELLQISIEKSNEYLPNNKLERVSFLEFDLEKDSLNSISESYDVITVFGVMHHIKGYEKRKNIIRSLLSKLKDDGLLIVTFWEFHTEREFMSKHVISKDEYLKEYKLDDYDFILSFGGNKEIQRYCHSFTNSEITLLLNELGVKPIDRFRSDGIKNRMNHYVVI